MKTASPNAYVVNGKRFKARTVPVSTLIILIAVIVTAAFSSGVSAHKKAAFESERAKNAITSGWWQTLDPYNPFEPLAPLTSSLIVQIGFNPPDLPANFTVGTPNPESQPLRIQTQRADGTGENVTGAGQTVFIQMTTSSPTGRFDNRATGPFSQSTLVLTITNGRQNTQDFYYRDSTPGIVLLTARVTSVANTGLTFNETTSVTKSVLGNSTQLTFGIQPGNTNKDTIAPPISVRVVDGAGNLDTTSNRNVSLAIGTNPSGGTLSGTTTVAAVSGIATFNNLSINKAGNGYTLVASSSLPAPPLTSATSLPFNINKIEQTIDFDELEDKTYGDDDFDVHATGSSGLQVSLTSRTQGICRVNGNVVSIAGAGTCTIRASLTGDADHNAAADVDRSFCVNKADAAVVVEPYDVTYNGLRHTATVVSITGVYGETDAVVGTVDLSETVHTNAGSYVKDGWAFAGSANYKDAWSIVDNNISKAPVTAHAGTGSATFDGSPKLPSPCSISGPGYLGDLTCSNDPAIVGPNANSYAIGATVNGTGLSNFDVATINGTFAIEKAPTVLSVSFEPGSYAYRGAAFAAAGRVTGAGGLDQAVPALYSGDCVNVTTADGCIAAAEFPESANYLGSMGSARITIAKRSLNVSASSHVLTFGDSVPVVMPSFEGFVLAENASVIDSLPNCLTTYAVGSPVGTYSTNCSGGIDNNYSFGNYATGTITVNTACSSFEGFASPIGGANDSPNVSVPGGSFSSPLRTFKLNSTIPFKFAGTCGGALLTAGIQTLSARKFVNGLPIGGNALSASRENRFQFTGGQWHLNFKTKDLGDDGQGTWLFEVTLFDGSKHNVWLAIRK